MTVAVAGRVDFSVSFSRSVATAFPPGVLQPAVWGAKPAGFGRVPPLSPEQHGGEEQQQEAV
ncbi:hypothetical protein F2Q36_05555 [Alistipes onderdonkii]|uniref:Uncharacterized protein n=1 Tax=Alistipes onderdonkii TaxID=328813 RepID=A0A1Y3QV34_9BACT|nr:hypothetical protein [Alistipes onderdonkii]KAA2412736.1 hypothetical protein F2X99_02370 [Alistipes onderdonkii]KAA2413491.1 hypothetical protein F2Y06_05430 [Alistipes onderdonkii]KAA2419001.1 hypothetical protein F2Y02_05590 [Alistipes onderdonkii]KAA2424291.1 hypothetical protein F2X88_02300 [Alistipes onderdonkii]KAA2425693.1 hypothetical protein F2X90_04520 [Alistipes onderdonkii]